MTLKRLKLGTLELVLRIDLTSASVCMIDYPPKNYV